MKRLMAICCLFLTSCVFLHADETIQIIDDGVKPTTEQKVVVKNTEIKEVTDINFDGTANDISFEIDNLKKQKVAIDLRISDLTLLQQKILTELGKLPPRKQ